MQGWIEYYIPDWRQWRYGLLSACKRRLRNIKLCFIKLFVQYLAAVLCFLAVFGMVKYFWIFFRHTPVGNKFLDSNPPEAILSVFAAINSDLVPLAFQFSIDTAVTCLLLGLVCQLFAIIRYLYVGRGLINRLFWYAFCSAITSQDLLQIGRQFDFTTGIILYLIPAVCLAGVCLELTSLLLPEVWTVFRLRELRQVVKIARIRNESERK